MLLEIITLIADGKINVYPGKHYYPGHPSALAE